METMGSALICLLAGMIGGFASSVPIGPINLWVVDVILHGRERTLLGFLSGVVFCDLAYASIAAWGYYAFAQNATTARMLSLVVGSCLIGIGIVMSVRAITAHQPVPDGVIPFRFVQNFLLGFFMVGANPTFLMFWIFAVDLIGGHLGFVLHSGWLALFVIGIALGDGGWFLMLSRIVQAGSHPLESVVVRRIRQGLALGFVAAGVYTITSGFSPVG